MDDFTKRLTAIEAETSSYLKQAMAISDRVAKLEQAQPAQAIKSETKPVKVEVAKPEATTLSSKSLPESSSIASSPSSKTGGLRKRRGKKSR